VAVKEGEAFPHHLLRKEGEERKKKDAVSLHGPDKRWEKKGCQSGGEKQKAPELVWGKGGVLPRLNSRWGKKGGEMFRSCCHQQKRKENVEKQGATNFVGKVICQKREGGGAAFMDWRGGEKDRTSAVGKASVGRRGETPRGLTRKKEGGSHHE